MCREYNREICPAAERKKWPTHTHCQGSKQNLASETQTAKISEICLGLAQTLVEMRVVDVANVAAFINWSKSKSSCSTKVISWNNELVNFKSTR